MLWREHLLLTVSHFNRKVDSEEEEDDEDYNKKSKKKRFRSDFIIDEAEVKPKLISGEAE